MSLTTLKCGRLVWDKNLMPEKEFEQRVTRIREEMSKENLDALLLYSDTYKSGNVSFVANYLAFNHGRPAMIVLPESGVLSLMIAGGARELAFAQTISRVKDIRFSSNFGKDCIRILKVAEASGDIKKLARVGLVGVTQLMGMRSRFNSGYDDFVKALAGLELVEATHIIENARMLKSLKEIEVIRKANAICDKVYRELTRNIIKKGKKEYEIYAGADHIARQNGASDFQFLMGAGRPTDLALGPPSLSPNARTLEKGDGIVVWFAVQYDNYWGEMGRTLSLGKTSPELVKLYNASKKAFDAAEASIKDGTSTSAVAKNITSALNEEGLNNAVTYDEGFGFGIGLDLEEKPVISNQDDTTLKAGMVLAIRTHLRTESGTSSLSDALLVTKRGCERMSKSDQKLVEL